MHNCRTVQVRIGADPTARLGVAAQTRQRNTRKPNAIQCRGKKGGFCSSSDCVPIVHNHNGRVDCINCIVEARNVKEVSTIIEKYKLNKKIKIKFILQINMLCCESLTNKAQVKLTVFRSALVVDR